MTTLNKPSGGIEFSGYEDLEPSREVGTTYQNDTGEVIEVVVAVSPLEDNSTFVIEGYSDDQSQLGSDEKIDDRNTNLDVESVFDSAGSDTVRLFVKPDNYYEVTANGDPWINSWNRQVIR